MFLKGYMVLERLHGTISDEHDFDYNITPAEETDMVAQIRELVRKVHATGWIHGDLTENNIMYKLDGRHKVFRLIDFEHARILTPEGVARDNAMLQHVERYIERRAEFKRAKAARD